MKDAEIDYSDIAPLDKSFFAKAREAWPPAKQQLTIRLDADVLNWLKTHGRGYQTRINRILRAAMESQRPRRPRPHQQSQKERPSRRQPKASVTFHKRSFWRRHRADLLRGFAPRVVKGDALGVLAPRFVVPPKSANALRNP